MSNALTSLSANELCKKFAATFLENGNYDALEASAGGNAQFFDSQAASSSALSTVFANSGFSGLAVHSVGYTPGIEQEKVIIYVIRGTQKVLRNLPQEIDGVPVIARVMGKPQASPVSAMAARGLGNFFEYNGRIACGSSCAPSGENYAGTVGAFALNGGRILALSNNHVFAACNHTPVGMPILSPATMDASPNRRAPTEICRYKQMVELRSGDPRLVPLMTLDAAVASVANHDTITSWQGDEIIGYDTPSAITEIKANLKVKKIGRTTGLTSGIVEAFVPTPWVLNYKSSHFSATVWFQNTWTVRSAEADREPFALPGDSGSLVVADDGSGAVGLLFAVNNKGEYAIIMPIAEVLRQCGNLQLLSSHGI